MLVNLLRDHECRASWGKVIVHVDLDAFYAQVEVQRDPERLHDRSVGVIQYNTYGETLASEDDRLMNDSNGSLTAVNYTARAAGVKRNHRRRRSPWPLPRPPSVQVPIKQGKAYLTLYRDAGKQVLTLLGESDAVRVERASIDECYLDLAEETHKRLNSNGGVPPVPPQPHQVHIWQQWK